MRVPPAVAVVPLLLVLLTWLSLRAVNTNAEVFDRVLGEIDRLTMVEAALHRDVLSARAGMLRNYDLLVSEVNTLNDSLGRLRKIAAADAEAEAAIDRLAASVAQQEELVEQFKSNNALLQNSLAYFGLFSVRLGTPDRTGPFVPAVSALVASMLRLTLDTSSAAAHEVQNRLDELARQPLPSGDADSVQALLAHGRMLLDHLPATDGILKALYAMPRKQDQEALRTTVLTHQSSSRATARRFRLLLYITSLLLVGLLVHLGLQLRARARALQRRAAFEHVITGISMRFVNAEPQGIDASIEQALADMAECVGADRAYFLLSGPFSRTHTWRRHGIIFPPSWPNQALALVAQFSPTVEGIVHVPYVNRLPPGENRDALAAVGLKGWACVPCLGKNGVSVLLGFDAVRQAYCLTRLGELDLLRMALDTLANAVRRDFLERERIRLETRLQQARRMETVGALASGIAHNFNNIVGAILGYAEMADEQVASDSRSARIVDEIRRAGERARELIDQILTFGRRRDARRKPMSVQSLIAEATSLLRASLPSTVEVTVRGISEGAIVSGEPAQLLQVILNLCNNAAQAMNYAGHIEIEIEVHELLKAQPLSHGDLAPDRYVRIAVSDTGRGMDAATLTRIFEPFFTTRMAGNGLGLATVREIVREHGGAMNVRSALGAGSCFEVWLPRNAAAASAPGEDVSTLPLGRGETVLVVEDERERLLRDEEVLAALGYEPVGFTRAADALTACRASPERFDTLVVGHLLPATSALELVAALHEIVPGLPVLLATASADEIGADALVAAGISDVVDRPIIATEIAAALTRCLEVRRRHAPSAAGVAHAPGSEITL
jgi:signal transduction histidine kinase/ActR/RegA family two-component response regulator